MTATFVRLREKLLTFFLLIYILGKVTFPDCVMVAPQILVLIVGVRILLGEYLADLRLKLERSAFFIN